MPRVLVYFDSPPNRKASVFAAWSVGKAGHTIEVVEVDDGAKALAALEHGPWDLAVIGFVAGESIVEAFSQARVPTLVGICTDTREDEAKARAQGATQCWFWPIQARLLSALILALLESPRASV
jgi:CheY-like chemotaxis protein